MSGRGGKRDHGAAPRSGHALSEDDAAVWAHTASTVSPLHGAKSRVHAAAAATEPHRQRDESDHRRPHMRTHGHPPLPAAKPHPIHHREVHASPSPPPLAPFDKRKARRIARGSHEIEARIDLHGLRQREAHDALCGFLKRCHADGLSTVLVITGKGARAEQDTDAAFDLFRERERGALKRNVPHWLAEPELRAIVVSHRPAAIRHGGEGALYVQLRRRRA